MNDYERFAEEAQQAAHTVEGLPSTDPDIEERTEYIVQELRDLAELAGERA